MIQLKVKQALETNTAKKVGGKPFVYWGLKNFYPNYLIDLYKYSSTHNAILNAKNRYVLGEVENKGSVVGINGETMFDIFKECLFQYLMFGGFIMHKVKTLGKTKVEVLSFDKCRLDEDGEVLYYGKFVSTKKPFQYAPINDNKEIQELGSEEFIVCFDNQFDDLYPTPEYAGATDLMEIDYRIGNYWNNFISNNFSAGFNINIFGKSHLTAEEKEYEANNFIDNFTSDDNAGRIIINFPLDKDKATTIEPIEIPDFVSKFEQLNKSVMEGIFIAHNITSPMLFGVRVEGQLGGRNELIDAFELFKTSYIEPTRAKVLYWLQTATGFDFGAIKFKTKLPLNIDITQIKDVLTKNEIREYYGFQPIQDGQNGSVDIKAVQDKVFNIIKDVEGSDFVEILDTKDLEGEVSNESEYRLLKQKMSSGVGDVKMSKTVDITRFDLNVLKVLNTNPTIDLSVLAAFAGLSVDIVKEILSDLKAKGYIIESENGYFVTTKGKTILGSRDMIYTDVRYSYDWRTGFSDKDKKTSRDFCVKLMDESKKRIRQNKLWTRADIESISAKAGWDVWSMRGGWYRLPGTEVSIPYCRHIWKQHIVIVKNEG